ncbi:S8 family serine peptidase [Kribbella yunnanensis]|uniref:S8 family serine peptidase n=1 Tax=Kribbella yunnanensis TaxID=190194 RepID=UPI0031D5795E
MTRSSRTRPAIAVLAVAGLALTGLSGQAVAAPAPAPAAPAALGGKDVQVTLITGDRVVLHGGDPAKQTVYAGPGREDMVFQKERTKDHSYVIPADAVKAVGEGRLDPRLFDVTGLIKAGYDDASSKVIPVLATYDGKAKRSTPVGAKVTRQLPSIKGAALDVDKSKAAAFLGKPTARSAGGFAKLWLDGKRKVTLDESVPQIGGPAAWAAGYTGKGVTVAVLDTGVDATHPDLATQVAGAKNFTTESAEDIIGHGTHVASTIAGTGAASGGKYKGVAPDAKIYDGKICVEEGCYESDMLAGMEWAAKEVKAKVVNFSIGGEDTPEIDPIEEAVNRLTAETGTLFVVAAGNSGLAGAGSVESPGSAEAALTVGAVDKQDGLAYFSSIGPRVGDSAVKPDVTAPGVDIVAAKAKNSSIGEPVGDQYLRLNGTSMATPHTAGAAALLAQEHPSWKAGELKSTLMGSAKVAADQTSFQQGAGRIDVAAAIKQTVVAAEGSLSFGLATYPHTDDEPVVKTLTYRNLGDQPITLNLATTYKDGTGAAAPADALQLSAPTVTVPAGGTASVQATSKTNHSGPDGLYSGRITATGGGQTVVVPVGADKEVESHTLTVQTLARDGKPSDYPVKVYAVDKGELLSFDPNADGVVKAKLPAGEYLVGQFQEFERGEEDWIFFQLVAPQVQVDADRTVVLDARLAKPVVTNAPKAGAEQATSAIGYDRTKPGVNAGYSNEASGFGNGEMFTYSTGPKLTEAEMIGHIASQWGVRGEEGFFFNTPYLYALAERQLGEFPTGYNRTVRPKDLAVVDTQAHATTDRRAIAFIFPALEGVGWSGARAIYLDTPRAIRYYVDAKAGWNTNIEEAASPEDPFARPRWQLVGQLKNYQAGRTYHEQLNVAAFGPAGGTSRIGNNLGVYVGNYGDASGARGSVQIDSGSSILTRNGEQVATSNRFGSVEASDQPAEKTTYKLVTTGTQSVSPFATRVDLDATFTSAATTTWTQLPIMTARFQPPVDAHNRAVRTKVTTLPLVIDGAKHLKSVKVEVSGDNGTTWTTAKVTRTAKGYKATFTTPAGTTISLRAHLIDQAGNTTNQSTTSAYHLK